ncbi:MAG: hypothetical protein IPJ81_00705 [Chitinophagaceae bacterium]|nr:hypothetical protein [Chitinophagaceae bacterium]
MSSPKVPEKYKWIKSLEKGERTVMLLVMAVGALSGALVYLFFIFLSLRKENTALQNDKIDLQNKNIACEKEKTEMEKKHGEEKVANEIKLNDKVEKFMQEKIDELKAVNRVNKIALKDMQQVYKTHKK